MRLWSCHAPFEWGDSLPVLAQWGWEGGAIQGKPTVEVTT